MYERIECVALRTIKYSDRTSILGAYSRGRGRLSLAIPAGNGPAARRMRALLQPLGRFECVADMRPGVEIHRIRDVQPLPPLPDASPLKGVMRLFLADLLSALLREPMPDDLLYEFITLTIDTLEHTPDSRLANFHIAFMVRLQRFLGVEPDTASYRPGYVLDMADGIWRPTPAATASGPLHMRFLPSDEAEAAHRLARINYRNAHLFRLTRCDRNQIVDRLLQYYRTHFPDLPTLQSLAVLRSFFDY